MRHCWLARGCQEEGKVDASAKQEELVKAQAAFVRVALKSGDCHAALSEWERLRGSGLPGSTKQVRALKKTFVNKCLRAKGDSVVEEYGAAATQPTPPEVYGRHWMPERLLDEGPRYTGSEDDYK